MTITTTELQSEELEFKSYESYEDIPWDIVELVVNYADINDITELTLDEVNEWMWELTYGEFSPILEELDERG